MSGSNPAEPGTAKPRRRSRLSPSIADDAGASVIEFVLMSALLVVLLFAVLQLAGYAYARNIVAASAADGARYAANQGIDAGAGGARASEEIRRGLNVAAAARIRCVATAEVDAGSGLTVATVRCHGQLPMVFTPFALPLSIDVGSSVLKEGAT